MTIKGVDPGAPGLQTTTRDLSKIIDIVDCTGSGDVLLSKPTKCPAETPNQLVGASGRLLKLNPTWTCPTGEFRLGVKRAVHIFPAEVVSRMKEVCYFTCKPANC
jgi:tripeptidyl-peptidase-2